MFLAICFSQILNIEKYQKRIIQTCPGQEQNGIDIYYNKCCAHKIIIDLGKKSDVELLRIFAALGVIVLHYNNPKGFQYAKKLKLGQKSNAFNRVYFYMCGKRERVCIDIRIFYEEINEARPFKAFGTYSEINCF